MATQRRHAYLIGANGPRELRLQYAERDVQRLGKALKKSPCNFASVEMVTAHSRDAALSSLKRAIKQCKPDDLFLLHYAGHACLDRDLYLVCNDTDIDDLEVSALDVNVLLRYFFDCSARHKILILDCCHAAKAGEQLFKKPSSVVATLEESSVTMVLAASSYDQRTRELPELDGGAGFLSWAFSTACSTHFHYASRDRRTLSFQDVCLWCDQQLKALNKHLGAHRLPSPILFRLMEGSLSEQVWLTDAPISMDSNEEIWLTDSPN